MSGVKRIRVEEGCQVDPNAEQRATLQKWISTNHFSELDKKGKEEFEKFIRDRLDKPNDVRRLKFYLGTPDMEKDFLLECLSGGRKQVLVDIHKDDDVALQQQAGDVVDYMNLLKRRMAPDLNTDFDQFKKYLGKLEN